MTEVKKRGRPPKKDIKINYIDIYSNDMSTGQFNSGLNINPALLKTSYNMETLNKKYTKASGGICGNENDAPISNNKPAIKSYSLYNNLDSHNIKSVNNIILHLKIPKEVIFSIEKTLTESALISPSLQTIIPTLYDYYTLIPANALESSESSAISDNLVASINLQENYNNDIAQDFIPVSQNIQSQPSNDVDAKHLLINNGINYKIHKIMQHDKKIWPASSQYCCWYCCHPFTGTPVGIPEKIIIENNSICFELSGNFCSYNCGYTYINPNGFDDISCINNNNDHIYSDDKSNKIQLLELLCSLECNIDFLKKIKPAPPRLSLYMFGGPLSIEMYRENFKMHNEFHIFKYPVVPISYNLGEIINRNINTTTKKTHGIGTGVGVGISVGIGIGTDTGIKNKIDYSSVEYICKIWENKCKNKTKSYSFNE